VMCAQPGHDRIAQGEQGHDDRSREIMASLARGQRREDGGVMPARKPRRLQGIGGERRQRAGDDAGEQRRG